MFYQLTRRLPHEELEYDIERIVTHLYDTFCNESIKLLGKTVRFRTNVLYHLLKKIRESKMRVLAQTTTFTTFVAHQHNG